MASSLRAGEPWIEPPPSSSQPLARSFVVERPFLRIATWNIEWFPAGQRRGAVQNENWQMAAAAHLINQIKPDILATQETRNLASLEKLNRNIGLWPFSHIASSIFYEQNNAAKNTEKIQQQCGILARHAWEEIWEIDFKPMDPIDKPTRGWIAARWNIGPHHFTLYNGHLKSDYGADNPENAAANRRKRLAAIEQLKQDLDRRNLDPYRDKIIVLGDFNADHFLVDPQEEKAFGKLADMGFRIAPPPIKREEAITVPARKGVEDVPDLVLDYIWLSAGWRNPEPELQILAEGASKRKDVFGGDEPGLASDHYPVYIDIPLRR
jgi:endonuclease/exonuclease/phosphatase family metal-dependent hydrolase